MTGFFFDDYGGKISPQLIIGDRRKDVTYLIMEETNLMSKAASEVRNREKKRGRV